MDPIIENETKSEELPAAAEVEFPKVSPNEAKARSKGWLPSEELEAKFKESGRDFDPTEVVTAKQYLEKGEMIGELNRLKKQNRDTDQRLSDNNLFWKSQLDKQKQDLSDKRDAAIDLADKDEVKKLDGQINDIDQQAAKLEVPINKISQEDLDTENDFFAALPNRSQKLFAKDVAVHFTGQGFVGEELVDAISKEMDKEFPPSNPRREKAALTESKSRSKSESKDLATDTLSSDDEGVLSAMRRMSRNYAGKSNTELLKILKDSKL